MPPPEAESNRSTEPDDEVVFKGRNKKVVPRGKQQEVPEGSPIKGPSEQPPYHAQKQLILYFSPDIYEEHSDEFEVYSDKAKNLGKHPEINTLGWAAEAVEPCSSANYFYSNPRWESELEPKLNANGEDTTFCEVREAIQRLEGWQYRTHGLDNSYFEHAWAEEERLKTGQEFIWGGPELE